MNPENENGELSFFQGVQQPIDYSHIKIYPGDDTIMPVPAGHALSSKQAGLERDRIGIRAWQLATERFR